MEGNTPYEYKKASFSTLIGLIKRAFAYRVNCSIKGMFSVKDERKQSKGKKLVIYVPVPQCIAEIFDMPLSCELQEIELENVTIKRLENVKPELDGKEIKDLVIFEVTGEIC